ncbi:thermonuclease family protein [Oceanobacillus halotolerans]|uniref:thermonuclease family protein n=1 Tax=Oceanobacillus halotolerans TaxID=2663380 RepID=UPI0013DD09EF|nr:thermonuclease family protein [Oceanobacillus halotolerans]
MMKKLIFFVFLILVACSSPHNEKQEVTFIRIVDGDTLIAEVDGQEEYIRLLLVDTPETKKQDEAVQPFGPEASKLMENTFSPNDTIVLENGSSERDNYDRILAYVYTEDGQMFNEMLLAKGLARVAYVFPPNDKYVEKFREIEKKAKKKQIGIWSIEGYVTDEGFSTTIY